jgi:hypothetical protein
MDQSLFMPVVAFGRHCTICESSPIQLHGLALKAKGDGSYERVGYVQILDQELVQVFTGNSGDRQNIILV